MTEASVRFVTRNTFKIAEASQILAGTGVSIIPLEHPIEELQTPDAQHLVREKAFAAFDRVHDRVFVEHTGLYLDYLNGLPGGLTQIFWDELQADRFAELFGTTSDVGVTAKTIIGYIDGRHFHSFAGEIRGAIVAEPRGPRDFQWDCVFQPDGHDQTFAEMGDKKSDISMRRIALDRFAQFLGAVQ
jgi:XTP/dITP diphosphohydrolase